MGIGETLWNSPAWQQLYKLVKIHLAENIKINISEYKGLTMDMIGALTYYTSDVQPFGGNAKHSLFAILNPLMMGCEDLNDLKDWNGYLWYAFEAYKILPRYIGTTYRGIDRPLYNFKSYQPGYELTYNCFTSSTTSQKAFKIFLSNKKTGTWIIFKDTFSGVELKGVSLFPKEGEVLFFPGTIFKVSVLITKEMKDILEIDPAIDAVQFSEIQNNST